MTLHGIGLLLLTLSNDDAVLEHYALDVDIVLILELA
jgi:hypothetical protein